MAQFFVNQKYRRGETWTNNVHVKEDDNVDHALNLAKHQFHAFMSTYGYEQVPEIDYASCSVEDVNGNILMKEVDNRIPEPTPEETYFEETETENVSIE